MPVTVSTSDGFDALLAIVTLPEAVPVACGVNVTVKPTLVPGFTVTGNVTPLTINSPLLEPMEVTVTLPPVATSCPVNGELLLTVTLPKLKDVGFTLNVPTDVPVPLSDNVRFGMLAFEVISKLPLFAPVVVGAKVMPKVKLCPAVKVIGRVSPLTVKAVPVTVALEIVTLVPPGFFKVSDNN